MLLSANKQSLDKLNNQTIETTKSLKLLKMIDIKEINNIVNDIPKRIKAGTQIDICTPVLIKALVTIAKR